MKGALGVGRADRVTDRESGAVGDIDRETVPLADADDVTVPLEDTVGLDVGHELDELEPDRVPERESQEAVSLLLAVMDALEHGETEEDRHSEDVALPVLDLLGEPVREKVAEDVERRV